MELDDLEDLDKTLHIKGQVRYSSIYPSLPQMLFVSEWQQMLFLACPIMKVIPVEYFSVLLTFP